MCGKNITSYSEQKKAVRQNLWNFQLAWERNLTGKRFLSKIIKCQSQRFSYPNISSFQLYCINSLVYNIDLYMINRSNNCLKVICFRFTPIYISKEKINQKFLSALLFLFLTPKNRQQGKQKTKRLTRNSRDSVLQPFCHCF